MTLNEKLQHTLRDIKYMISGANDQVAGKKVTILTNFNGQPHGRSKKSLKGSIQVVKRATFDQDQIWLWLEDDGQCWCAISVHDVEFLSDCGDQP